MKRPNETDASVSHLRFSSAKIRALMQPQSSQRESAQFTWTPSAEQLDAANIGRLARSLGCSTYDELHRVSVEEPDRFWRSVVDDLGIPLARPWDEVLDGSRGIEWTTWFFGARLNIAEACVHRWAREMPDREAAWRTYGAAQPMGRLGTADECADAALWLVSSESSFVTGVALPVDGGFTAM